MWRYLSIPVSFFKNLEMNINIVRQWRNLQCCRGMDTWMNECSVKNGVGSAHLQLSVEYQRRRKNRRKSWDKPATALCLFKKVIPYEGKLDLPKLKFKTVGLPSTFLFKDNYEQIKMTANTLVKSTNGRVEGLKTFLNSSNYSSVVCRAFMFKRNKQTEHSYSTNGVMFEECIVVVMLLSEQHFVSIIITLFWALLCSPTNSMCRRPLRNIGSCAPLLTETCSFKHVNSFLVMPEQLDCRQLPALVENTVSCGRKW